MCLLAFDFRPSAAVPLRLMANRDEWHARPTAPLAAWEDAPSIRGGRDLAAGGGWLAMHERGRFAAVTNVRDPRLHVDADAPSRGALVRTALECDDLPIWLARLAEGDALRYAGFNLLAGDGHRLWHLHRGRDTLSLAEVSPGVHGLSNATLDTPWPKLLKARQALAAHRQADWPRDALPAFTDTRQAKDDQLPDTGIPHAQEKQLSSPFILGGDYGTRTTTWLEWHANGHFEIHEQRFGPHGIWLGENRFAHTP